MYLVASWSMLALYVAEDDRVFELPFLNDYELG